MEEPSAREIELAVIMDEFKLTHYYKALAEIFLNAEFEMLQDMIKAPGEELKIIQAKYQGAKELMFQLEMPGLKLEAYKEHLQEEAYKKGSVYEQPV